MIVTWLPTLFSQCWAEKVIFQLAHGFKLPILFQLANSCHPPDTDNSVWLKSGLWVIGRYFCLIKINVLIRPCTCTNYLLNSGRKLYKILSFVAPLLLPPVLHHSWRNLLRGWLNMRSVPQGRLPFLCTHTPPPLVPTLPLPSHLHFPPTHTYTPPPWFPRPHPVTPTQSSGEIPWPPRWLTSLWNSWDSPTSRKHWAAVLMRYDVMMSLWCHWGQRSEF